MLKKLIQRILPIVLLSSVPCVVAMESNDDDQDKGTFQRQLDDIRKERAAQWAQEKEHKEKEEAVNEALSAVVSEEIEEEVPTGSEGKEEVVDASSVVAKNEAATKTLCALAKKVCPTDEVYKQIMQEAREAIAQGADINIVDEEEGQSLLAVALSHQAHHVVSVLIEHGASFVATQVDTCMILEMKLHDPKTFIPLIEILMMQLDVDWAQENSIDALREFLKGLIFPSEALFDIHKSYDSTDELNHAIYMVIVGFLTTKKAAPGIVKYVLELALKKHLKTKNGLIFGLCKILGEKVFGRFHVYDSTYKLAILQYLLGSLTLNENCDSVIVTTIMDAIDACFPSSEIIVGHATLRKKAIYLLYKHVAVKYYGILRGLLKDHAVAEDDSGIITKALVWFGLNPTTPTMLSVSGIQQKEILLQIIEYVVYGMMFKHMPKK